MKEKAIKVWVLTEEEDSDEHINYLDITIYKPKDMVYTNRLRYMPYIKN
jgi:hypothetical protein